MSNGSGASVPPGIEVFEPLFIEVVIASVVVKVHLFKGLVEEVVQLIAAVVVTATFTWAWRRASVGLGVISVGLVKATVMRILDIATACEDARVVS